jgi:hypothetical protein
LSHGLSNDPYLHSRTWLTGHSADRNTVESYRFLMEAFVIPVFGDLPLTKVARIGSPPLPQPLWR